MSFFLFFWNMGAFIGRFLENLMKCGVSGE
jgi:hypothetical protein